MTDSEVILKALQRERDDLHERIMQIDRIIKRVKTFEQPNETVIADSGNNAQLTVAPIFTNTANIKVQVLRVFDIVGRAATLKELQTEYAAISGNNYNIRETVRVLQKSTLVRLIKDKTASRGFMWVKSEWIDNGQLADKYKPEGFDLLHKPENLIFE